MGYQLRVGNFFGCVSFLWIIPSCSPLQESTGAVGPAGLSGAPGELGPQGIAGPQGDPGVDGADGQLRIYGYGTAGELTVTTSDLLYNLVTDFDIQFTDITVEVGQFLTIPSGQVIRCTGTFTNRGNVVVTSVQSTAGDGFFLAGGTLGSYGPPGAGISSDYAGAGELGDNSQLRGGGLKALGIFAGETYGLLLPGPIGGGGGAGSIASAGGAGGGTLVILAQGGIVNETGAIIRANGGQGGTGAGGGGGGVIVLASPGSILNLGSITANGGNGGASGTSGGIGGGGGGGIVHLVSPSITPGNIDVSGGTVGTAGAAMSVIDAIRSGGGGGGAGGADGGNGGDVTTNGTPSLNGQGGSSGYSLQTLVDPTPLF